jgi:gliding motility-associated-like protein
MKVFVFKDVFVPSAFTPNNDGLNDTWNIPALNAFPEFILSVYNRYGQLIYQNKGNNIPWDGKYRGQPQPSGVYVYYIDLKVDGGKRKGTVTLIR